MVIPPRKACLHLENHQYSKNQIFYKFKNQIFQSFFFHFVISLVNNRDVILFRDQIETCGVINPKQQRKNLKILVIQYFLKNYRLGPHYLNFILLVIF